MVKDLKEVERAGCYFCTSQELEVCPGSSLLYESQQPQELLAYCPAE